LRQNLQNQHLQNQHLLKSQKDKRNPPIIYINVPLFRKIYSQETNGFSHLEPPLKALRKPSCKTWGTQGNGPLGLGVSQNRHLKLRNTICTYIYIHTHTYIYTYTDVYSPTIKLSGILGDQSTHSTWLVVGHIQRPHLAVESKKSGVDILRDGHGWPGSWFKKNCDMWCQFIPRTLWYNVYNHGLFILVVVILRRFLLPWFICWGSFGIVHMATCDLPTLQLSDFQRVGSLHVSW
jgi:hypothetical protein